VVPLAPDARVRLRDPARSVRASAASPGRAAIDHRRRVENGVHVRGHAERCRHRGRLVAFPRHRHHAQQGADRSPAGGASGRDRPGPSGSSPRSGRRACATLSSSTSGG
jgi:hypothetical protein